MRHDHIGDGAARAIANRQPIRVKLPNRVHSVLLFESSQVENLFELFVVTRVVLRETNVADVKFNAFFLELVRLNSFARRAAPETTENFLSFFGQRKIDE